MAGVIVKASDVSTDEQVADEKVIDMNDRIQKLDTDMSQFTTMSSRTGARVATREKVNWLEEELFPRTVTTSASAVAGATTLVMSAGDGLKVDVNDLLRNMRTGEGVRVTAVATDTLTIVSIPGQYAAVAVNSGDVYLVVSDSQPQGSSFPNPRYLQRVLGYNYTQITRTSWTFTGTDTAIELYGGREPGKEAVRKAIEHKRKWESIGFFGSRAYTAASGSNEPQGMCGGAIEFITSIKRDSAGPMTTNFFDQFTTDVFAHGSSDAKIFFCAPAIAQCMSQWNRQGMGAYWQPTPENVYGVKVDGFINGAYGYRVPVVVKKEWSQFPTANKGYGGYGFLLDMSYIERRPLRDRDTKLLTEQQPKGKDSYSAEYMTEASYQFACQSAHGIVFGVTPPP